MPMLFPVEQLSQRRFPDLVHKRLRGEPEDDKVRVFLKGFNCFNINSATSKQSGYQWEVPVPRRKNKLTLRNTKQQFLPRTAKEGKQMKDNEKNRRTNPLTKEEQSCMENFVLKSMSFQVAKPCVKNQLEDEESAKSREASKEFQGQVQDVFKIQNSELKQEETKEPTDKEEKSVPLAFSVLEGHRIGFITKRDKTDNVEYCAQRDKLLDYPQSKNFTTDLTYPYRVDTGKPRAQASQKEQPLELESICKLHDLASRDKSQTQILTKSNFPSHTTGGMPRTTASHEEQALKVKGICKLDDPYSSVVSQTDSQIFTPSNISGQKDKGVPRTRTSQKDQEGNFKLNDFMSQGDSRSEMVTQSNCHGRGNGGMFRTWTSQTRPSIKSREDACKLNDFISDGYSRSQIMTPRDRKNTGKVATHESHKEVLDSLAIKAPLRSQTITQLSPGQRNRVIPKTSTSQKELDDSTQFKAESNLRNQPVTQLNFPCSSSSHNAVLEKRETFQLPKVETYEISPKNIIDSKVCLGFNENIRPKLSRRSSSGEWTPRGKASILRNSVFNRLNEQHRLMLREPSPVAGVKMSVKDHEEILVNAALHAVEECNTPSIPHEDISPPIKKFVIRLPPIC